MDFLLKHTAYRCISNEEKAIAYKIKSAFTPPLKEKAKETTKGLSNMATII